MKTLTLGGNLKESKTGSNKRRDEPRISKSLKQNHFPIIIDADVANDPDSAANTSIPAEFARCLAVEWFIDNLGLNSTPLPEKNHAASLSLRSMNPTASRVVHPKRTGQYSRHWGTRSPHVASDAMA